MTTKISVECTVPIILHYLLFLLDSLDSNFGEREKRQMLGFSQAIDIFRQRKKLDGGYKYTDTNMYTNTQIQIYVQMYLQIKIQI